ncbi:HNH endonuclease [Diplocloster agilis]|uniref:HNH endonuclease n=1 Tax=Diplocloster agilis TaxID=2850323 RepID=UPI000820A20D|nr:HNH endonuclease [Suonthocola fibrivorans]MCU6734926.1 HNH endonuclease [Suonthocola fibrivorans]SCJ59095.1 Predicted restriction endonuclease [uncultured Clostridium sp.]
MEEKYFSWDIKGETAIKHIDTSVVRHHGSGIPIQTRAFWDVENLSDGEKREIVLIVGNREYDAFIEKRAGRTRLFWRSDFREACGLSRYLFSPDSTLNKLTLQFQKLGENKYNAVLKRTDHIETTYLRDIVDDSTSYVEGKKKAYYTTKYERDKRCRNAAIHIHGCKCSVCGFDFKAVYGALGENYIEVHHKNPLYNQDEEVEINPETDLAPVCSNCHRMLHRRKDRIITIEELQKIINKK